MDQHRRLPPVALAQLGMYISLIILCWITVLTRLYVRIFVVKGFGADDKFMIAALVGFTALAVLAMGMAHLGLGQHEENLAPFMIKWVLTIFHCEEVLYGLTTVSVKFSIMRLLLRLASQESHRLLLHGTAYFYLASTIVFVTLSILQCWPVPRFWDMQIPGHCLSLPLYTAFVYVYGVVNLITDGVFTIWPIYIIQSLQLDRSTKISTGMLLALVFLASGVNLARFKYIGTLSQSTDRTYHFFPLNLTSNLEIAIGIIAASLGTLRPLLKKIHWRPKFRKIPVPRIRISWHHPTTISNAETPFNPENSLGTQSSSGEKSIQWKHTSIAKSWPRVSGKLASGSVPEAGGYRSQSRILQSDVEEWIQICEAANSRASGQSLGMV